MTAGATEAEAASVQDTVSIIEYNQLTSGNNLPYTLLIQTSTTVFTAYISNSPSGCSNYAVTLDTVKAWQSLATSALLSGKQIKIYYTVCAGANMITTIDLDK
ncbi:MAG TPA: hypothetical protein VFG23_21715 [Polyangia bacterium]|nr:hypothetical protein [Polyangia bacterium]